VHQLTRHLAKVPRAQGHGEMPLRRDPSSPKMMHATLEAFGNEIAAAAPLKRIGRPSDMAGAAIFSRVTGGQLHHGRCLAR